MVRTIDYFSNKGPISFGNDGAMTISAAAHSASRKSSGTLDRTRRAGLRLGWAGLGKRKETSRRLLE